MRDTNGLSFKESFPELSPGQRTMLLAALLAQLPKKATIEIRANIYQFSPEQEWYDKGQNDTIARAAASLTDYIKGKG